MENFCTWEQPIDILLQTFHILD